MMTRTVLVATAVVGLLGFTVGRLSAPKANAQQPPMPAAETKPSAVTNPTAGQDGGAGKSLAVNILEGASLAPMISPSCPKARLISV